MNRTSGQWWTIWNRRHYNLQRTGWNYWPSNYMLFRTWIS